MGLLTTLAASVARHLRRLGFASPAHSQPYRPASAGRSGYAPRIEPMPSGDGLELLQARRLALLTEAKRQKHLRRSKRASTYEAELRDVTHQILSTRTGRHA